MPIDPGPGLNWEEQKTDSNTEKKKKELYEPQGKVKKKFTEKVIVKDIIEEYDYRGTKTKEDICDECGEVLEDCECEDNEEESYDYTSNGSSFNLISAGIFLVVGVIVLVVVAQVINSSINQVAFGSTAFVVIGFITVGLALGLLVRSFATIDRSL